jgi:hypothetical protein
MAEPKRPDIEDDEDAEYPSGPWVGFYNYEPCGPRYGQEMDITFRKGRLAGEGLDSVGPFFLRGGYDREKQKVWWTKTYPGSHDVFYQGFREGKGIWGTWEIGIFARGGFRIWPKGLGSGIDAEAEAEGDAGVEAGEAEAVGPSVDAPSSTGGSGGALGPEIAAKSPPPS